MAHAKRFLFGLLLLIGVCGFIEAAASLFYYFGIPEQTRHAAETVLGIERSDSNSVLRYVPHPYFNYISNPEFRFKNGYQPHNALGLRNSACCPQEKRPGTVRIVAVGGSTTYGMAFTFEKNVWPALLEKKLRVSAGPSVEVINAGVPNYTTYEMLGLVAMLVPEFAPDIVLLHLGLNDAFTVGYENEGGPDNRQFRHAWSYRPLPSWAKRMMTKSYAFRLIGMHGLSSEGFAFGDMATAIQRPNPSESEVQHNAERATGKYFRRNLQTLVAIIKNMGAIPILINMPLNPAYESGQGTYYDAVAKAVIRNNRISREVAAANQLLYIDLFSKMRATDLFIDAAHVNQAGMEIKASELAQQLLPTMRALRKPMPLQ